MQALYMVHIKRQQEAWIKIQGMREKEEKSHYETSKTFCASVAQFIIVLLYFVNGQNSKLKKAKMTRKKAHGSHPSPEQQ